MRKSHLDDRLKNVYITIGKNIFRLRGKMTQEELAKKAKITRTTLGAIEEGKPISLRNLIKIANALEVKPADLFITDGELERVSYLHILLMARLAKYLGVEPEKGKKE